MFICVKTFSEKYLGERESITHTVIHTCKGALAFSHTQRNTHADTHSTIIKQRQFCNNFKYQALNRLMQSLQSSGIIHIKYFTYFNVVCTIAVSANDNTSVIYNPIAELCRYIFSSFSDCEISSSLSWNWL